MIILTLLLLEGMAFMLGHILGRQHLENKKIKNERKGATAVIRETELKNFFDYDGSEQG